MKKNWLSLLHTNDPAKNRPSGRSAMPKNGSLETCGEFGSTVVSRLALPREYPKSLKNGLSLLRTNDASLSAWSRSAEPAALLPFSLLRTNDASLSAGGNTL